MSPRRPARLTSQEVADRLGVRLQTVYAYVSRGLLSSERDPSGRGSTFDRAQVEALLDGERRRRPATSGTWRGPVVDTDVTLIEDGRLSFRGVDAVGLSRALGFEAAAHWLWTGEVGHPRARRFTAASGPLAVARAAVAVLPEPVDLVAALRVAVAAASAAEPLRFDVRPSAVLPTARGLVAVMVDALPVATGPRGGAARTPRKGPDGEVPVARRLWSRLTARPADEALLDALEAALVLLLDHDLAVSTVAVRTAASVRANPYAVVATGLSAMEGPLHGAASALADGLLREVLAGDARSVVADRLRAGQPLPGFGHRSYPDGDPRATELLDRLHRAPAAAEVLAAVDALEEASGLHPNVDLALAALGIASGMPRSAGEVVFSVARSVGWVAHALEEYDETPLRFRGHGAYRGPRPPQPVPTP
ncbi:citrate synthase [Angustibacter peucedani]